MRRNLSNSLAAILILVLGLGSGAEALPAGALSSAFASGWTGKVDESRLPACCRRNGKHHCAMNSDGAEGQAAEAVKETAVSVRESCPLQPHSLASTAPQFAALAHAPASSLVFPDRLRSLHGIVLAAELSARRNWPKRGPPVIKIL